MAGRPLNVTLDGEAWELVFAALCAAERIAEAWDELSDVDSDDRTRHRLATLREDLRRVLYGRGGPLADED